MSPGPTGSPSRTPARSSASRRSSAPTTTCRWLGDHGRGSLDAWGTINALAAITTKLRLGALVSPATFRHPSVFAKLAVTADHVSDGRIEVGLGAGWMEAEHRAYGFPFPPLRDRMDAYAEQLEIVHRSFEPGPFTFHGKHFTVEDLDALPKPIQQPHPPFIVGGSAAPRGARLGARWADEYNFAFASPAEAAEKRHAIHEACRDVGRDPVDHRRLAHDRRRPGRRSRRGRAARGRDRRAAGQARSTTRTPTRPSSPATGSSARVDEAVARLREYEGAGIERVFLQHLLHRDLDAVELLAREVIPALRADVALPPGPRSPEALQTVEWMARPTAFLRRCSERYGDVFTICVSPTREPMVLTSDTDLIRRLFTEYADVARGGARTRGARAVRRVAVDPAARRARAPAPAPADPAAAARRDDAQPGAARGGAGGARDRVVAARRAGRDAAAHARADPRGGAAARVRRARPCGGRAAAGRDRAAAADHVVAAAAHRARARHATAVADVPPAPSRCSTRRSHGAIARRRADPHEGSVLDLLLAARDEDGAPLSDARAARPARDAARGRATRRPRAGWRGRSSG